MIPLPKFIDVHPSFNTYGYLVTNEEPELHARLLDNAGVKKVRLGGGICSGGEIPLFVLLQRCDHVIAIDHSYEALAMAYAKSTIISALGVRRLLKLHMDTKALTKALVELRELLLYPAMPAELFGRLPKAAVQQYGLVNAVDIRELSAAAKNGLITETPNIGKLTLVHGDLSDLAQFGKFDVLYLSNACGHVNRFKKSPSISDFESLLTEKGYVLACDGRMPSKGWRQAGMLRGSRSSWNHYLFQKV